MTNPNSLVERGTIAIGVAIILLLIGIKVAGATSISLTSFSSQVTFTNPAADTSEIVSPFKISGQSLINGGFLDSDTLNSGLVSGSTEIPSQPPSLKLRILSAKLDDGGVFTTETTGANNSTANDVTLLPAVPVANDAYYFGTDHQFRILTISISTAGDWVGDLAWEYYNGASWASLPDIDDRTLEFTKSGEKTVSFSVPSDWVETTVDGVTNYWIRARVSAFTSITTQPLGTQLWYETGQWWTFIDSILASQQVEYQLGLGGVDVVNNHKFFPGNAGYVVSDAATLEVGDDFDISIEGFFNTDATVAGRDIVNKTSAMRIYTPSASTIRLDLNGGGVVADIPSPVANGVYTLTVESDGANVTMRIIGNEVLVGEITTATAVVTDNANNWEFATDGIMPFLDHVTVDISSVERLRLEPQEMIGLTLSDRSGNGNNATTSFPIVTSAVTSFISSLSPTGVVSVSEPEITVPETIGDSFTLIFDEQVINTTGLPFSDLIQAISDGMGLHPDIVWTMIAFAGVSLSGLGAFKVTGGSLPAAVFIMILVGLFAVNIGTNGLIPMWVFIIFAIKAFAILALTWNRQRGSGLS